MKAPLIVSAALVLSVAGLAAFTSNHTEAVAAAPAAQAKSLSVDAVHSSVVFKIKHNGASNFYGTFNDVDGTFAVEEGGAIDITVKAESVDSRNTKRDDHIKSGDFLSAKEFPTMTFKSKTMKKKSGFDFDVTGDLTFRGVTKPVSFVLTHTGVGQNRGGEIHGAECKFTFKRSDFGNSTMIGPLSDEVEMIVSLEGAAK